MYYVRLFCLVAWEMMKKAYRDYSFRRISIMMTTETTWTSQRPKGYTDVSCYWLIRIFWICLILHVDSYGSRCVSNIFFGIVTVSFLPSDHFPCRILDCFCVEHGTWSKELYIWLGLFSDDTCCVCGQCVYLYIFFGRISPLQYAWQCDQRKWLQNQLWGSFPLCLACTSSSNNVMLSVCPCYKQNVRRISICVWYRFNIFGPVVSYGISRLPWRRCTLSYALCIWVCYMFSVMNCWK